MDYGENREFIRIWPPIFKMHPEDFAKLGLTEDEIRAVISLQLDLSQKIAQAHVDYCIGLKKIFPIK